MRHRCKMSVVVVELELRKRAVRYATSPGSVPDGTVFESIAFLPTLNP